jgi:hypothetical protein
MTGVLEKGWIWSVKGFGTLSKFRENALILPLYGKELEYWFRLEEASDAARCRNAF